MIQWRCKVCKMQCDEFVCVHQISGLCLYECDNCKVVPCEVCIYNRKCKKERK